VNKSHLNRFKFAAPNQGPPSVFSTSGHRAKRNGFCKAQSFAVGVCDRVCVLRAAVWNGFVSCRPQESANVVINLTAWVKQRCGSFSPSFRSRVTARRSHSSEGDFLNDFVSLSSSSGEVRRARLDFTGPAKAHSLSMVAGKSRRRPESQFPNSTAQTPNGDALNSLLSSSREFVCWSSLGFLLRSALTGNTRLVACLASCFARDRAERRRCIFPRSLCANPVSARLIFPESWSRSKAKRSNRP
jgi:hypothetical protein